MEAELGPAMANILALGPTTAQAEASTSSQTQTITTSTTDQQQPNSAAPGVAQHLVLRLAPKKKKKKKGVQWAEDVVDNEGMEKKKSKKCCIFHRQRAFGDWSDEDSDDECEACAKEER